MYPWLQAQTDKELKMQKISMIRFMYEQACEECQVSTKHTHTHTHTHTHNNALLNTVRLYQLIVVLKCIIVSDHYDASS